MKALQLTTTPAPPEIREVADPEVGAGQVVVRIGGAGACHSDLHMMDTPGTTMRLPFTLGHEGAGWVEAVGAGVSRVTPGEAVAVYGAWGCGRCHACGEGKENYCELTGQLDGMGPGLGRDGTMATYLLVPSERFLVPLHGLDPRLAAPLTDAALTPYHAIKRSLGLLVPGTAAVVIGVGGLGHMAIQLLRAVSPSQVIAVDSAPDKLELAESVGADHVVAAGDGAAKTIRDLTDGLGAQAVFDFVGAQETVSLGAAVASVNSQLTIVGLAGGVLPVGFGKVPFECSVSIPYWGSRPELIEVLALARQGRIKPEIEEFSLEEGPLAYERMREGKLRGRAVLVPGN